MARKEKIITVDDRGNQLNFKIKEMPALKLESWLIKAGLLIASTGAFDAKSINTPSDAIAKATETISKLGISSLASIDFDKAEPLLNDLLGCCYHLVDGIECQLTPDIIDGIIQDVRTLFQLRKEALTLNLGFFMKENPLDTTLTNQSQVQSKPKISVG